MAVKTPASNLDKVKASIKIQTEKINPAVFKELKDMSAHAKDHDKEYKHHDIEKNSADRHPKEHKHPEHARKSHTHPEYKHNHKEYASVELVRALEDSIGVVKGEVVDVKIKSVERAPVELDPRGWEFTVNRLSNDLIHTITAKRIS